MELSRLMCLFLDAYYMHYFDLFVKKLIIQMRDRT